MRGYLTSKKGEVHQVCEYFFDFLVAIKIIIYIAEDFNQWKYYNIIYSIIL